MSEKKATVALDGYLQSADVIKHMIGKFKDQGYNEATFRNDSNAKKITPDKKISVGKSKKLLFTQKRLEQYVRDRAELYSKRVKTGNGPIKKIKSPDLTEFTLSVYKSKLDSLRLFLSDEEIKNKLVSVLDSMAAKAVSKINEMKQSIEL